MRSPKVLFIGGGNITSALVSGLMNTELFLPHDISVLDHNADKLNNLKKLFNITIFNNLDNCNSIIQAQDIIILAVKPHHIQKVCESIFNFLNSKTVVVSVAAGVSISQLEQWLSNNNLLLRAMPNTPVSINQGVTILYAKKIFNFSLVETLFQKLGEIVWVQSEEEITTSMAISGCGPAYIFLLCESLLAAASSLNIPPKIAKLLIKQTIHGACSLYANSCETPETLRKNVTSPNGTTEAAIKILDPQQQKQLYTTALQAAVHRAKEIEANI